jgi:hypothetical protein
MFSESTCSTWGIQNQLHFFAGTFGLTSPSAWCVPPLTHSVLDNCEGCSESDNTPHRHWKDHFKSDFRSDQDHLIEKWFQIRSRSTFFLYDLDLKSRSKIIFCSLSPLFEGKFFKKDKKSTLNFWNMTFLTSNQTKRWHLRFLYLFSCFFTYFDKCLLAFNISSQKWSILLKK